MGYIYILPWLIGFCLLTIWPFVSSLYCSFTDYNMIAEPNLVGIKNYLTLFKDQEFVNSLIATLKYTVITVPLQLIFALFVAFILNFKLKAISLYRTAYYIPSLLGGNVAIAILWRFMFQPDGFINTFLETFGISPVNWLSTPGGAMAVIVLLKVWQFGSSMLLFLAALKEIPQDLYEAAAMDGSTKVRTFFTITIPLITPTIFFNLIMQTIQALQNFTSAFVITDGGPLKSTYVLGMKLYKEG